MKDSIFVTRPALPPLDEFYEELKKIWESGWITNNGNYHQQFEKKLASFLGIPYISLFANGTLALITALQSLRITGEVITTPYSFVATSHALHWNNIKPVFVDIEEKTLNLNPEKIEAAITPQTTAILPVHVYGIPCNMEAIQKIADTYGLKVIYDAAHAFGVRENNVSILDKGDLSILSFHATKVFNTIEGGAIVCKDETMKQRIDYLKNFGFADEVTVVAPGINAKMNEVQAAYGLLQLKYFNQHIAERRKIAELYTQEISDVPGIKVGFIPDGLSYNYAYFSIFVDEDIYGFTRDELYSRLKQKKIYARRYFYPLISQFPTYKGLPSAREDNLPVAVRKAEQVLCLPIFPGLSNEEIKGVCTIIRNR